MDMMPTRTGAPTLFSTNNHSLLKVSRNAEIGTASGRSTTAIALELRIVDQSFESLFIAQMKTLGYNVAQVVGMDTCLALCINMCLCIRHDSHSLRHSFIVEVHTLF